ncbi:hypothetical protein NDU88_007884 [Pleurodeles waltl]|uniref:Uncharacterized protein n=1 Tax=Pleurodeles waltl TaxID=8319 RepID=A0AAV7U2K1_PLEWA|nr:hypothetical protein NDU88_007884 [Pleurodeles waltl]
MYSPTASLPRTPSPTARAGRARSASRQPTTRPAHSATASRSRSRSRRRTRSRTPRRRSPSWSSSGSSVGRYSPTLTDSPPARISPVDDITTFNEVLLRGAQKLNIEVPEPATSSSVIFETLQHRSVSRKLLPLVPGLLQPTMDTFLSPATLKSAPARIQKKYKAPEQDPLFLRKDPPPDSVILAAARKTHSVASSSTVPPDKESRHLDSLGRKMCGTAASAMKVSSASALLGRYDRSLWDSLHRFTEKLPREDRQDFQEILQEGGLVSNQVISAAADGADLAAHGYAHRICARRSSWLRLTGLKQEAQQRILNLPFSGSSLFGTHADEEMARMKTEVDTMRAVGLERKKDFRRRYRPYDRRPFQQRVQTPHWSQRPQQRQGRPLFQARRPTRDRGASRPQQSTAKTPSKQ